MITNHTAVVTKQEAEVYGNWALEKGPGFGRYYDYYFQVADLEDDGKIVVYLDSSDIIDINMRLLYVTIGMIFLGMIFAAVFTLFFSKWAITSEICKEYALKMKIYCIFMQNTTTICNSFPLIFFTETV